MWQFTNLMQFAIFEGAYSYVEITMDRRLHVVSLKDTRQIYIIYAKKINRIILQIYPTTYTSWINQTLTSTCQLITIFPNHYNIAKFYLHTKLTWTKKIVAPYIAQSNAQKYQAIRHKNRFLVKIVPSIFD